MIPVTLSFIHTIHIFARPVQPLRMAKSIEWNSIVELRNRHVEVKLNIAEVAKKQKSADSLPQYMRHEEEFRRLVRRDEHVRKQIARLLTKYFEQQKTQSNRS